MTSSRSAAIRAQLIAGYKAEQDDHVAQITQGLLALEKGAGSTHDAQAILAEVFREAHSLKGAARALGLTAIEELAHGVEDLLGAARETGQRLAPEHNDLILRSLDACGTVLASLESGQSAPSLAVLELARALGLAHTALRGQPEARPDEAGENGREEQQEDGHARQAPAMTGAPAGAGPAALPAGSWAEAEAAAPDAAPVAPGAREGQMAADSAALAGWAAAAPGAGETIRVAVEKLDTLMEHLSELALAQIRMEQRLVDLRQLEGVLSGWRHDWLQISNEHKELLQASAHPAITPWLEFLQRNRDNLNLVYAYLGALHRQLNNDRLRLSLVSEALDDEVKRVRMLPLSTLNGALTRMVRDLARGSGKQVTLRLIGTEVELDKRVLELIKDPLVHLLRNAVDHGVELPEARARQGKPSDGRVTLAASTEGNYILVRVTDDGAGLDLEAIRARALEKGLLTPAELAAADEHALAELIFAPGLSTSPIITDLSGRGVGLDVVRHNVEELQGSVTVSFKPGRGTTFTLRLPLTLTSVHGLLVRAGGQTFALPLAVVERLVRFERGTVASVEGQDALLFEGRPVGLVRLADLLGLPSGGSVGTSTPGRASLLGGPEKELAVLLSVSEGAAAAGKRLAVLVEELMGEQEIVVKKLTGPLSRVPGIAGVTVLGTGRAVLILNATDLLRLAARGVSRTPVTRLLAAQAQARRRTILVVDDSVTTRSLEKNLLSAAGYDVRLAADGEEALASLATQGSPDLIISDVMMPRLDGFSLTQRLREDTRFREIPVILVTSLDSPADKARGIAVGADAYIVKSDFDQSNLLATIEQLL